MEPPGLFQSPLLLAAKMFDVVLQPGKLLDGQLGRGLTQGVVKLAAGVGQRLLGFGRVTGRAGAVPLPCPALRLVHLSGGPGSGAGGGRGLQPLQLPRQPLGLVPQCSLFGGKPLQCALATLRIAVFRGGVDLLLQALLARLHSREIGLQLAQFLDQADGFLPRAIGQHVEDLLQATGDLLLAVGCLPDLILPNLIARVTHLCGDGQTPSLAQCVGHQVGGQRITLPQ